MDVYVHVYIYIFIYLYMWIWEGRNQVVGRVAALSDERGTLTAPAIARSGADVVPVLPDAARVQRRFRCDAGEARVGAEGALLQVAVPGVAPSTPCMVEGGRER